MSNKETGGAAFPCALNWIETDLNDGTQTSVDVCNASHGMSLRDYFAAKCAQALPAPSFYVGPQQTKESLDRWARQAFQMADAMLAARSA